MSEPFIPQPGKPISFAELERAVFPDDNFIIGNKFLPSNGFMVIGGVPKSYKSFVSTTILYHLATGTHLFNTLRYPNGTDRPPERMFEVPRPQRVLYLEQEIGYEDVRERWSPSVSSLLPVQAQQFRENIFIYSRDISMRLDAPEGIEFVDSLIRQVKPDVVCFDPLIEFHCSDENDASEMNRVLRALDVLRQRHGFACIVCHHSGKNGDREGADRLRGSSVLYGKGDCFLMLEVSNRSSGIIQIDPTIRRGKPLLPFRIKLNPQTLLFEFYKWGDKDDKRYKGNAKV